MSALKDARFDIYFKAILAQLHAKPESGHIRASNCEVELRFDEKPLLDIRKDEDIVALAGEIGQKYATFLLG